MCGAGGLLDEALLLSEAVLPVQSPQGVSIGEALPYAVFISEVLFVRDVHESWCPGVPECGVQVVIDVVSEARADEEALEVGDVVAEARLHLEGGEPVLVQRDVADELCPAFDVGALCVGGVLSEEQRGEHHD